MGPGSPLDYPELRINNLAALNDNPFYNQDDNQVEPNVEEPPTQYMTIHSLKCSGSQGYRYCNKCSVWKPDRSHHCSSSGKCILKMDHYCPWFSTCIGYFNYKFFVQFLVYVAIYCGFVFAVSFAIVYNFIFEEKYQEQFLSINLIILCVLGIAMGLSVGVFAGFSIYLTLNNLTTIEFQERRWNYHGINDSFTYSFDQTGNTKKVTNIYDLGIVENWKSVMGPNLLTWLLPINVTNKSLLSKEFNNGVNFRVNEESYARWCQNAELQEQLNQQLRDYKNRLRRDRTQ
ncbi:PFA3 [[Candida] subhashii]|uniref:Palmitoyltransferase n=1 Tax=[Candida] subhashii TaxID=561895 RepID=A0A8J5URN0_9ASCO|nr:PFA3 [[Candida] subhashii]KAG7665701.1 PFA3 [[Candida] subhashii]